VGLRLAPRPGTAGDGLLAIPLRAVAVGQGGERHVFVHDSATWTVARRLVALAETEGEAALIAEGLAPGEVVAAAGLPFLRDGMRVALMGTGIARYDP
jgi:multidrug efflux pump subunit AcrA (membrane-fusion protein)